MMAEQVCSMLFQLIYLFSKKVDMNQLSNCRLLSGSPV